jgi:hypothetical protein
MESFRLYSSHRHFGKRERLTRALLTLVKTTNRLFFSTAAIAMPVNPLAFRRARPTFRGAKGRRTEKMPQIDVVLVLEVLGSW